MIAAFFIVTQYAMPWLLLVVAAFVGGLAVNRSKNLEGRPVAPYANAAAYVVSILPAMAMVTALAAGMAPRDAIMLKAHALVAAITVGIVVLAFSTGCMVRRRMKRETPKARWDRMDTAIGLLALNPGLPISLLLFTSGPLQQAMGVAYPLIPIVTAVGALYLAFGTRTGDAAQMKAATVILVPVAALITLAQTYLVVGSPIWPARMALAALAAVLVAAAVELRRRRTAKAVA